MRNFGNIVTESIRKVLLESEQDDLYLKAYRENDADTAMRMVWKAASMAMPDTKVVNRCSEIKNVYHGTPNGRFNSFDKSRVGEVWDFDDVGFFFTDSNLLANDYSKPYFRKSTAVPHIFSVYLNIRNPLVIDKRWWSDNFGRSDIWKYDAVEIWDNNRDEILHSLKSASYDGIIINPNPLGAEPIMYVVLEPSQIKSAEPFTFDDNGSLILLSQRFDFSKNDIRY